MVKIIEGYLERKKEMDRYDEAYKLAEQVFDKRRLCKRGDPLSPIIVRGTDSTDCSVIFNPQTNLVVVNDESDLESAVKLAELAEKAFSKEIELRKDFPPKDK